jgi:pimeloyl-ACP methyl ester carboxylesterase
MSVGVVMGPGKPPVDGAGLGEAPYVYTGATPPVLGVPETALSPLQAQPMPEGNRNAKFEVQRRELRVASAGYELELLESLPIERESSGHPGVAVEPEAVILNVHGSWHGGKCFEEHDTANAEAGIASYSVSLRGHGKSEGNETLRSFSVEEAVQNARDAIAFLQTKHSDLHEKLIIVGHSFGARIAREYLKKYVLNGSDKQPAGFVSLAEIPKWGSWEQTLRFIFDKDTGDSLWTQVRNVVKKSALLLHATLRGDMNPILENFEICHKCLFGKDLTQEQMREFYEEHLKPGAGGRKLTESMKGYRGTLGPCLLPSVLPFPSLMMGGGADVFVTEKNVRANAEAAGGKYIIIPDCSHNGTLKGPHAPGAIKHIHDFVRGAIEKRSRGTT